MVPQEKTKNSELLAVLWSKEELMALSLEELVQIAQTEKPKDAKDDTKKTLVEYIISANKHLCSSNQRKTYDVGTLIRIFANTAMMTLEDKEKLLGSNLSENEKVELCIKIYSRFYSEKVRNNYTNNAESLRELINKIVNGDQVKVAIDLSTELSRKVSYGKEKAAQQQKIMAFFMRRYFPANVIKALDTFIGRYSSYIKDGSGLPDGIDTFNSGNYIVKLSDFNSKLMAQKKSQIEGPIFDEALFKLSGCLVYSPLNDYYIVENTGKLLSLYLDNWDKEIILFASGLSFGEKRKNIPQKEQELHDKVVEKIEKLKKCGYAFESFQAEARKEAELIALCILEDIIYKSHSKFKNTMAIEHWQDDTLDYYVKVNYTYTFEDIVRFLSRIRETKDGMPKLLSEEKLKQWYKSICIFLYECLKRLITEKYIGIPVNIELKDDTDLKGAEFIIGTDSTYVSYAQLVGAKQHLEEYDDFEQIRNHMFMVNPDEYYKRLAILARMLYGQDIVGVECVSFEEINDLLNTFTISKEPFLAKRVIEANFASYENDEFILSFLKIIPRHRIEKRGKISVFRCEAIDFYDSLVNEVLIMGKIIESREITSKQLEFKKLTEKTQ